MGFPGVSIFTAGYLAAILVFLSFEVPAVMNDRPGDTFTEHVRWIIGIGRPLTWPLRIVRIVFLAVMIWLPVHFGTGWV